MKKSNLFLVLMMALIVMSCSKDETTMSIPQESNAIEFGTYVGRDAQTRAPVLNDDVLKTGAYKDVGFGILAYYTAQKKWESVDADDNSNARANANPNFMWNQQVKYATDKWTYNPIKYWPTAQNDKVSFFAYAPYNGQTVETPISSSYGIVLSGNAATNTNNPTIQFTLQDTPDLMVDLVTASVVDQGNKVAEGPLTTAPQVVNFTFKHALSRVNFIAKAADKTNGSGGINDQTIINITDVKLDATDGFYKSGTYTLSSTDANGLWSFVETDKLTDVYNLANIVNKKAASHGVGTPQYVEQGIQVLNAHNGTNAGVSIFNTSQFLFLIPPTEGLAPKAEGSTESLATVTFTYDIVTADANLALGYSVTTAVKTVALPSGTLKQGIAYNYTFTFGLDQVEVNVTEVAGWGTPDPATADTPVDYTDPA